MIPQIVDVEFTSRCNLECGFCFGPSDDKITPNLPTIFWLDCLSLLAKLGVKGIVVSGGEPTLHPDLEILLKCARENNLSVVLSTHGRFKKRILNVAKYCDWISLPVDGMSDEMNKIMRGDSWGLKKAVDLAQELKNKNPLLKIKLGTVANKINIVEINELAENIYNLQNIPFDTWKIYQYTPRRKFIDNSENYSISNQKFSILKQEIMRSKLPGQLNIVFSSNESRKSAYLFVYPDGTVAIPNNGPTMKDILIGNLFTEGVSVMRKIKVIDNYNHLNNYKSTYIQ